MAGAALVVAGCGGVLGPKVGDAVEPLPGVNCVVQAAAVEDQSYAAAVGERVNGFDFLGRPADNLRTPAVRRRVFTAQVRQLQAQRPILEGLRPESDIERRLVSATRADLAAALALVRYDLRWAPGDPRAPDAPTVAVEQVDEVLRDSSPDIRRLFAGCTLPADVARRQTAYAGG